MGTTGPYVFRIRAALVTAACLTVGEPASALVASTPSAVSSNTMLALIVGMVVGAAAAAGIVLRLTRRQDDGALRESERSLRTLIEHAPDAIVILDVATGRFADCNTQAERLFGLPREALLRVGPAELSPPRQPDGGSSAEVAPARVAEAVAGGAPVFEWVHRNAQGEDIPCEVRLVRMPAVDRTLVRGSVVDIRERKRTEDALRASEEMFAKAFRSSPDALAISGLEDGRFVDVNDGFCEISGYSRDEVIGRTAGDLRLWVTPEDYDRFLEQFQADGRVRFREIRQRMKSGAIRAFLVSAERLEIWGKPHLLTISSDITERRRGEEERHRLEAQLRQAHKMEAIGRLAGGIAHDFNNMLLAILGYSELARDDLAPDAPARNSVEQVITAASRAQDVVRQILAFSRQSKPALKPLLLRDVVNEAVTLLRVTLPTTIELALVIDDEPGPILGDQSQMHQVLLNLGANAAHAIGDDGGTVAIGLRSVDVDIGLANELGTVVPGKYVCLTIRDTGKGMDDRVRDRIFDPFFTTKGVGEGTGLGLSAVHGIVLSHGGAISIDSAPGAGTNCALYFPRAEEFDRVAGGGRNGVAGGSERILFVDDEPQVAKLGERMLGRLGYTVTAETDSVRALEEFRSRPETFDLIVVDLTMPRLSGLQFADQVRQLRDDIPIILATGYSELETRARIAEAGITASINKPYTAGLIDRLIRETLSRG